jgi:hypothetical protein
MHHGELLVQRAHHVLVEEILIGDKKPDFHAFLPEQSCSEKQPPAFSPPFAALDGRLRTRRAQRKVSNCDPEVSRQAGGNVIPELNRSVRVWFRP